MSLSGNIWNDIFRKSQVLPVKIVAMVTPDNLENQKKPFVMFHRAIFKVTKFQLPPLKRLSIVIQNILSNMVNEPKEM